MIITCPHCGFSKEVDENRIPAGAASATCPRCRKPFPLKRQRTAAEGAPSGNSEAQAEKGGAEPVMDPAQTPVFLNEDRFISPIILPKAGFWIRVVATAVDSVLVTAIQFVLQMLLGLVADSAGGSLTQRGEVMMALISISFGTVLAIAYYVFFVGYCGQTPGKMAVRVKIIRTDGSEIGYGRAFLREVLGKFISGILLGIGYLMVAFDPQKQGLHDKIADTYVIKT